MARRESLPNQPASRSPNRLGHDPIFDSKDTAEQNGGEAGGRKRSTSFTSFFNRLLPSHRSERGGTLRHHGFWEQQESGDPEAEQRPGLSHKHGSDSIVSSGFNPPISLPRTAQNTPQGRQPPHQGLFRAQSHPIGTRPKSLAPHRKARERERQQHIHPVAMGIQSRAEIQIVASTAVPQPSADQARPVDNRTARLSTPYDTRREARRQRRSLKESRDFLGVQGINPHTGVMDVLTPTSSSPTDGTAKSAPEAKGFSHSIADSQAAYQRVAGNQDAERASFERLRKEQARLDKAQSKKDSVRAFQRRVRWRKDKNQWSSVAEPDLSPIADASTRSATPRSASEGVIVPPAPIKNGPGWESHRRAVSTPAGLQTNKPTDTPQTQSQAQARPEITTQESSDTVIHTPNPNTRRRYSLIASIFGNGTKSPSSKDSRRASEPGPGASVEPRGSSSGVGVISRKPVPPRKDKAKRPVLKISIPDSTLDNPKPSSTNHTSPFLGSRTEAAIPQSHRIGNRGVMGPSTPVHRGQDENSPLSGAPSTGQTPIGSLPDVAVRDFAGERSPHVSFMDHPLSLASLEKQGSSQGANAATVSSQERLRTLRLRRASLTPPRTAPSRKDTSPLSKQEVENRAANLIDAGNPSPLDSVTKSSETEDSLASGWAQEVMQDIAILGSYDGSSPLIETAETDRKPSIEKLPGTEVTKSAYTPITTTTGYDPRLLTRARGLRTKSRPDGYVSDSAFRDVPAIQASANGPSTSRHSKEARKGEEVNNTRVTGISTTERIQAHAETVTDPRAQKTHVSTFEQQPAQQNFDLLASPPRLPPSVWPSIVISPPQPPPQWTMPPRAEHRYSRGPVVQTERIIPHAHSPGPVSDTTSYHPSPPTIMDYQRVAGPSPVAMPPAPYSPSLALPPPITPTTSARQLMPTRERCERLCRRVSRPRSAETLMTPAVGVPSAATTPKDHCMPADAYDSARSSNSSSGSLPSSGPGSGSTPESSVVPQGDRDPATEAARTALVGTQYGAATAKIVHVVSRRRTGGAAASSPNGTGEEREEEDQCQGEGMEDRVAVRMLGGGQGEEDIDGPSRGPKESEDILATKDGGNRQDGTVRRVRLLDDARDRNRATEKNRPAAAADVLVRFLSAYWALIAPVFDAASPVSQRYSAGRSTWRDCGVYLLALVFVVGACLLLVWSIKGVLLVVGLARAVGRGTMLLVGF